jgi:hypothetical protein
MDKAWQSFGETAHTPFVEKCLQLGVAFLGLMQQWGDSAVVLDEDGELVAWPVFMM